MQIRPFQTADESALVDLWNKCELIRPVNDPVKDIRRKLDVNPEWFLVGIMDGKIIASVMAGYEGHRGWIKLSGGASGTSPARLREANNVGSRTVAGRGWLPENQFAGAHE
jgi:hypothetical protein